MTSCALSQSTLVLNRSWYAIDTTPVSTALRLLFKGAAVAIRPDTHEIFAFDSWASLAAAEHEPCIKTANLRIRVPEVIALTGYDGMPIERVPFTRRNLFRRDGRQCQYCGVRPGTAELTIDHILPQCRGGKSSWDNCVLACVTCNQRKADLGVTEAGLCLRVTPVEPPWTATFRVPLGRAPQSWETFVSQQYWDTRLEQ